MRRGSPRAVDAAVVTAVTGSEVSTRGLRGMLHRNSVHSATGSGRLRYARLVESEGPPDTASQGAALGETWSYGAVPPVRLGTPAGELAFGSTVDRYVVLD